MMPLKSKKITQNEEKQFIKKQESNQLFKKQPKVKKYFPIYAKHKYDISQLDLVDTSNLATSNKVLNFISCNRCIFSFRFCSANEK